MSYKAPDLVYDPIAIGPLLAHSAALRMIFSGSHAVANWPLANLCLYTPAYVSNPVTVYSLFCNNGTVSGNICMGLYNEDGTQRLANTGPVAQAGANIIQDFPVTAFLLPRGRYWIGLVGSATATQIRTWATPVAGVDSAKWFQVCEETLGATQVPTTMTPVASARAIVPLVGIRTVSQAF